MRLFFLALLVLAANVALAQKPAKLQGQGFIDSLLKELPKQKEDTNKGRILQSISFAYRLINPDEGINYGRQDSALASKLQWKKEIGSADNSLGVNYQMKADYPKALQYFSLALQIFEEIGHKKSIGGVTSNIGTVYYEQDDYPKALEYYFKALKIHEEIGNKPFMAITASNIGMIYLDQSDYPKALEYELKALKIYEDMGNKQGVVTVTGNLGNICHAQGDYPKALEYYFKALKMDEESGNKKNASVVTGNIGNTYTKEGNYLMAIAYTIQAYNMAEEIGAMSDAAQALLKTGYAYLALVDDTAKHRTNVANAINEPVHGNYVPVSIVPAGRQARLNMAISYLQRGVDTAKKIGARGMVQDGYESLARAYKLSGDYKKAMEYGEDFRKIKDSIFSQDNNKKIASLEARQKEARDSVKTAALLKEQVIKEQHTRNYMYIAGGVILLLLGFTFILTRNNGLLSKERKKSDDLLLNILPEEVAGQLKDKGSAAAKRFDNVTVLFTDFVDFTKTCDHLSPEALVEELDACFKKFDEIVGRHGIEKIKTIGDAYLACAGLPIANPEHASKAILAAKEISAFMQDRHAKLGNRTFEVRIGVHSGSVVAGIVGNKKFAYDIWGDTVNTAARMEQNCEPARINISETTYELVKDKFACEYRGEIEAKGKGLMRMYYLG